ncbi:unnamed protein product [Schistosoma turkestanicum]|nr:unnamed protein product [Schistosoma turkestanicum]
MMISMSIYRIFLISISLHFISSNVTLVQDNQDGSQDVQTQTHFDIPSPSETTWRLIQQLKQMKLECQYLLNKLDRILPPSSTNSADKYLYNGLLSSVCIGISVWAWHVHKQ